MQRSAQLFSAGMFGFLIQCRCCRSPGSFLGSRNFSGSATNPAGSGCAPFVRTLLRAQEPDVFLPGLDEKPLDLAAVRDGLLDLLQEARLNMHRPELPVLAKGVLHRRMHLARQTFLALPRIPARLVAHADGALGERHERGETLQQLVAILNEERLGGAKPRSGSGSPSRRS